MDIARYDQLFRPPLLIGGREGHRASRHLHTTPRRCRRRQIPPRHRHRGRRHVAGKGTPPVHCLGAFILWLCRVGVPRNAVMSPSPSPWRRLEMCSKSD